MENNSLHFCEIDVQYMWKVVSIRIFAALLVQGKKTRRNSI